MTHTRTHSCTTKTRASCKESFIQNSNLWTNLWWQGTMGWNCLKSTRSFHRHESVSHELGREWADERSGQRSVRVKRAVRSKQMHERRDWMSERTSEWPSNLRVDYIQFQPRVQGVMRWGMHLTFGYHTLFPFSLFKAWDENETELTHKRVVQQKCCRAEMQLERKTTEGG